MNEILMRLTYKIVYDDYLTGTYVRLLLFYGWNYIFVIFFKYDFFLTLSL